MPCGIINLGPGHRNIKRCAAFAQRRSASLLSAGDFLDQCFKARIAAQSVEKGIDFDDEQVVGIARLIGMLQLLERAFFLTRSKKNKRQSKWFDIARRRLLASPLDNFSGLICLSIPRVCLPEHGKRVGIVVQLECLLIFRDRFGEAALELKGRGQVLMCQEKPRIDFQRLARLSFCFVVPTRIKIYPGEIGIDDQRKWIELERALPFSDCLIESPERHLIEAEPMMSGCVIWL